MAERSKGNASQPGDPGLNDFLAGIPEPSEREKAIASYSFFQQGQPSGFSAHLATLFKAFARTLMAAAVRIEKAADVAKESATLQAKLTDAQVAAIRKALGEDVKRAASGFRYTEYVVNWGLVAVIGGLSAIIGAGVCGWFWYNDHHAITDTHEYWLHQALSDQQGWLSCTTDLNGSVINVDIQPGQGWTSRPAIPGANGKIRVVIFNTSKVTYPTR